MGKQDTNAQAQQPAAEQPKRSHLKPWMRAISICLALLFIGSAFLYDAVIIKIRKENQTQSLAAGSLMDSIDYLNESAFSRAREYLSASFTTPETANDYYKLASIQIGQGNYERAIDSLEHCMALFEGEGDYTLEDLYMQKGCLYAMLSKFPEALECFSYMQEQSKYRSEVTMLKSRILLEQNKQEEAIVCIEEYLADAPDDADAATLRAEIYYSLGRYEEAALAYTQVIEMAGDSNGERLLLRASCYMTLGEYQKAIDDFVAAANAGYEKPALCYEQAAICYFALGDDENVLTYGKMSDQIETREEPDLYYYMGICAMRLANYKDSAKYCTQSIQIDAENLDAYYYRGVSRMALQNYNDAIADFSKALQSQNYGEYCLYNRGLCYIQTERPELAKQDFETLISNKADKDLVSSAKEILKGLQ